MSDLSFQKRGGGVQQGMIMITDSMVFLKPSLTKISTYLKLHIFPSSVLYIFNRIVFFVSCYYFVFLKRMHIRRRTRWLSNIAPNPSRHRLGGMSRRVLTIAHSGWRKPGLYRWCQYQIVISEIAREHFHRMGIFWYVLELSCTIANFWIW